MIRRHLSPLIGVAVLAAAGAASWLLRADQGIPETFIPVPRPPHITPDYAGVVLPPNIAPVNFSILEPGIAYRVRLHADQGRPVDIASTTPAITVPPHAWRDLLQRNRGGRLVVDVYVEQPAGQWCRFGAIENNVAREAIDSHLVYRLLGAIYVNWGELGIYQRSLETYDEQPILCNTSFQGGCVNCHAFTGGQPHNFSLQVRPPSSKPFAGGMISVRGGQATRIAGARHDPPALPTYTAWHPRAPVAVVSLTRSEQFMHGAGQEVREVYDRYSDLALVNAETGQMSVPPMIADPGRIETFPTWSADGTHLYFCSAPSRAFDPDVPAFVGSETVRYDLVRVPYDITTGNCGAVEPVLTAEQTGRSISEPRVSPDGQFLLCCMTNHGAFPVLQADCDLYLLDLRPGRAFAFRPLDGANSSQSDSWHSWCSNSRWIVFSSKRDNGLLARPYFCYIDEEGRNYKPFVLPQRNPSFYERFLKTYNVPELTQGAVRVPRRALVDAIVAAPHAAATQRHQEASAPN